MCSRSKHSDGLDRCTADVIKEGLVLERAVDTCSLTQVDQVLSQVQVLVIIKCAVTGVLRHAVNVVLLGSGDCVDPWTPLEYVLCSYLFILPLVSSVFCARLCPFWHGAAFVCLHTFLPRQHGAVAGIPRVVLVVQTREYWGSVETFQLLGRRR